MPHVLRSSIEFLPRWWIGSWLSDAGIAKEIKYLRRTKNSQEAPDYCHKSPIHSKTALLPLFNCIFLTDSNWKLPQQRLPQDVSNVPLGRLVQPSIRVMGSPKYPVAGTSRCLTTPILSTRYVRWTSQKLRTEYQHASGGGNWIHRRRGFRAWRMYRLQGKASNENRLAAAC